MVRTAGSSWRLLAGNHGFPPLLRTSHVDFKCGNGTKQDDAQTELLMQGEIPAHVNLAETFGHPGMHADQCAEDGVQHEGQLMVE